MAKLSMGIVGLPNVGKSTLFKLITKIEVNIANYPFATIDPNVGVVTVPDERLDKLAAMSDSKKIVPAVVEFYDIAGLVKGANAGEGLGNQFLSHIREVSAIVHVVRCFKSDEIIHVESGVDPLRDIDIIETELVLKDLDTVEKRLSKLEAEAKGDPAHGAGNQKAKDLEILKEIKKSLNQGNPIYVLGGEILKESIMKEVNLLTAKPQIFLLNGEESDVAEDLKAKIKSLQGDYIVLNLSRAESVDKLIRAAYKILGLMSFYTTGETETRAWTIYQGDKAPQAAGVIHSDFEKKFIRAEVVNCDKLLEAGSWSKAKQKGWMRLEGKDYTMQDGDVVEIRHG